MEIYKRYFVSVIRGLFRINTDFALKVHEFHILYSVYGLSYKSMLNLKSPCVIGIIITK